MRAMLLRVTLVSLLTAILVAVPMIDHPRETIATFAVLCAVALFLFVVLFIDPELDPTRR